MTTKLDPDYCPKCGLLCDAVSDPEDPEGLDSKPQQGDISICINCAKLLVFDKDLKLQPCPEEKINSLDEDTLKIIVKTKAIILGMKLE